MTIDVAIEACDSQTGLSALPVIRRIKFFLRQRGKHYLETVKLNWRQDILEQTVEIVDRYYLSA
jgi:hypothetical protein